MTLVLPSFFPTPPFLVYHALFLLLLLLLLLPFTSCALGAHDPLHSGHPWPQMGEGSGDICLGLHTGYSRHCNLCLHVSAYTSASRTCYFVCLICYMSFVQRHLNWERFKPNSKRNELHTKYGRKVLCMERIHSIAPQHVGFGASDLWNFAVKVHVEEWMIATGASY